MVYPSFRNCTLCLVNTGLGEDGQVRVEGGGKTEDTDELESTNIAGGVRCEDVQDKEGGETGRQKDTERKSRLAGRNNFGKD